MPQIRAWVWECSSSLRRNHQVWDLEWACSKTLAPINSSWEVWEWIPSLQIWWLFSLRIQSLTRINNTMWTHMPNKICKTHLQIQAKVPQKPDGRETRMISASNMSTSMWKKRRSQISQNSKTCSVWVKKNSRQLQVQDRKLIWLITLAFNQSLYNSNQHHNNNNNLLSTSIMHQLSNQSSKKS